MSKISFLIVFLILGACSSGVEDIRESRRLGSLEDALGEDAVGEDGSEELVLPHQTTGSFLVQHCKWHSRNPGGENVIACRVEDKDGNKFNSKSLDYDAFSGGDLITKKIDNLSKDNFWHALIYVDGTYSSGVDVAYFLDGKEQGRQSVDMLLLQNQGIRSVRPINKSFNLTDVLDAIGTPPLALTAIETAVNVAKPSGTKIQDGNVYVTLPERKSFPEIFCTESGDNLLVKDSLQPVINVSSPPSPYYWDPTRFYKTLLGDLGLPTSVFGDSLLNEATGYLVSKACDEVEKDIDPEIREFYSDRCNRTSESMLSQPILSSKGFCLRLQTVFGANERENTNYCDMAIFENTDPNLSDFQFFMAFGNNRMEDVISDLKANSKKEAIMMYLNSFPRCDEYVDVFK